MKLYLTRHGQTEWNLQGRYQGRLHSNLTDLGVNQAKWLGKHLESTPIDIICSSSSKRAVDTAKYIKGNRDISIEYYDDLKEIDLGHWQGKTHDDVQVQDAEQYHNFFNKPEAFVASKQESFQDVISRGGQCLEHIANKHAGKSVLIVSHGVLLKGILAHVKGLDISEFWSGPFMKSTCLNIIEYKDYQYTIKLEGDIGHYIV